MIRTSDLYTIGTSGVRAQQELLQTTSNNIANVNTQGYVRERTSHVSQLTGGVGRATTERIINAFAQNQLQRDTSQVGEFSIYHEKASQLDKLFGSSANSLATSLTAFFKAMQTSASQPTNISSRKLAIGEANALNARMKSMGDFLNDKSKEVNLELDGMSKKANSLIQNIASLNKQIQAVQSANKYDEPGKLKNERDKAILELSELIPLSTIDKGDGRTLVNLKTGQSLVLEDGTFNVLNISGDPDPNFRELQLSQPGTNIKFDLGDNNLGGKIGGLLDFRNNVLATSQRELGQMALVFADSMNQQNKLGMDFDGQLGSDVFTLPKVAGLAYSDNANISHRVNAQVEPGRGNELTSADYQVTITGTAAAPPRVSFTVALLNPDGSAVKDSSGTPITTTYANQSAVPGTFVTIRDGLQIEFPDGNAYTANDKFLVQPTKNALNGLDVKITRGEDLALASPIRVQSQSGNLGNASITGTNVTNTTVGNTATGSAFTAAGGIHAPGASPTGGGGVGAPARIVFTSADSYTVQDSAGTVISTVTGATDLNDLITKARGGVGWPAAFNPPGRDNYPGYDVSLQGVPKAGDRFDISFNTGGTNDNSNGLKLAALQNKDTVRRDPTQPFSATNSMSYHEAYGGTVSDVGQKTSAAETSLKAAEALKTQSKASFDSSSGVNLDEEAANLIRFQQSYSASARILSTAQTIFDTILSALR